MPAIAFWRSCHRDCQACCSDSACSACSPCHPVGRDVYEQECCQISPPQELIARAGCIHQTSVSLQTGNRRPSASCTSGQCASAYCRRHRFRFKHLPVAAAQPGGCRSQTGHRSGPCSPEGGLSGLADQLAASAASRALCPCHLALCQHAYLAMVCRLTHTTFASLLVIKN